jgi:hypothetical protein
MTHGGNGTRGLTSREPLPGEALRVEWHRALGFPLDRPPIVTEDGRATVVSPKGDVLTLRNDGQEESRVETDVSATGALARTTDGTFVFLSLGGDAVGVFHGKLRFRTVLNGERSPTLGLAPLPLVDGGFAVVAGSSVVIVDAMGRKRVERAFPEPPAVPLVDGDGALLTVGASGAVFAYVPDRAPVRWANQGALETLAAFHPGRGLLATADARRVALFDRRGHEPPREAWAGPHQWVSSPAVASGKTAFYMVRAELSRASLVALGPSAEERWSVPVASYPAVALADAGVPFRLPGPHHGTLLADPAGTVVVATPTGGIAVVSRCDDAGNGCHVSYLNETPCSRAGPVSPRLPSGIVGLAAGGTGAFYVACDSGTLVRVSGSLPKPPVAPP